MLVLASLSPRRQELLRNAGIEFVVAPANLEEERLPSEPPRTYAERLARDKARVVAELRPNDIVLGADTVVVVDSAVLEKPRDAEDAARMLRLLSGRSHRVTTGVCLIGPDFEDVRSETTTVYFQPLTEADIAFYADHGEPMDKAGAYAIQGIASRWISRLEGCYFNVVGLPVPLVWRMLRENAVRF